MVFDERCHGSEQSAEVLVQRPHSVLIEATCNIKKLPDSSEDCGLGLWSSV